MRRHLPLVLTVAAVAAVALVVVLRWDEVADAAAKVPAWTLVAGVGLHVVTLLLRSEALRVSMGVTTGDPMPRMMMHGVNAGAFLAGAAQPHAAIAVRVGLLARFGKGRAPRAHQVAIADVPIVTLEVVCTTTLLALASLAIDPWWLGPVTLLGAVGLLAVLRVLHVRLGHLSLAQGMDVLGHSKLRVRLLGFAAGITLLMAARIWLLLWACDLPATFASAALLLAALGVFGALPLGPSASPGAALAMFGASGQGAALVLGLAVSATSICAVLVYGAGIGLVSAARSGRAWPSARAARAPGSD
jgi:uncharacterized membrane protein YbhN (UPF0104 family)